LSSSTSTKSPTLKRSKSITMSPIKSSNSNSTSNRPTDHFFDMSANDQNSPEFFVKKFLDPNLRSVTTKIAASLEVSLRTRSMDWVIKFIHLKGLHVLCHALDYLNHNIQDRRDVALELEVEIIKCIKAIVNTKAGGKEVMDHPEYIHAVVFSITCPQWQTRKMVCELLAFLCYLDGYEHVVRGFELMKKFRKTLGIFDAWIQLLIRTLTVDKFRGNEELAESHLVEYALSNMILINALTSIPSNINYRIYLRNQFIAAGLQTHLLPKLEALDYNLLNIQIESYKDAADTDMEDAFGDEIAQYSTEYAQPSQLFDKLIENVSDTPKGTDYFFSIMKYLLWIKGDAETKQIVTDRAQHSNKADFTDMFGMPVGAVIQNFMDLNRLRGKDIEANELREQYEKLIAEKDQLESEVQKLRIIPSQMENEAQKQRIIELKNENSSLRQVLKTSKETITSLQERLAVYENEEKRRLSSDSGRAALESMRFNKKKRERLSLDEKRTTWFSDNTVQNNTSATSHGFSFGDLLFPFFGRSRLKKKRPISDSLSRTE
ncbi:hypothetical protein CU098_003762, partial [Rhizopus stolonifer]